MKLPPTAVNLNRKFAERFEFEGERARRSRHVPVLLARLPLRPPHSCSRGFVVREEPEHGLVLDVDADLLEPPDALRRKKRDAGSASLTHAAGDVAEAPEGRETELTPERSEWFSPTIRAPTPVRDSSRARPRNSPRSARSCTATCRPTGKRGAGDVPQESAPAFAPVVPIVAAATPATPSKQITSAGVRSTLSSSTAVAD